MFKDSTDQESKEPTKLTRKGVCEDSQVNLLIVDHLPGYSSWKSRGWCQFELAVNGLLGDFAALRH